MKTTLFVMLSLVISGCSLMSVEVYQDSNVTKTVTRITNGIDALNTGD